MSSVYDDITEKLVMSLEEGKIPWKKPWRSDGANGPTNLFTGRPYTGINIFILGMSPFQSPYWMGFGQMKKCGGWLKKGSQHTKIIRWAPIMKTDDAGETHCVGLTPLVLQVFNTDQMEKVDIKKFEERVVQSHTEAEKIVDGMPKRPELVFGGNRACYSLGEDKIRLPKQGQFVDDPEYYSTLFHEMVHSTGHESRLGRLKNSSRETPMDYAREELVAECGAQFLMSEAGLDNQVRENSVAYIQGWLSVFRQDKTIFLKAARAAQTAANFILGKVEEKTT